MTAKVDVRRRAAKILREKDGGLIDHPWHRETCVAMARVVDAAAAVLEVYESDCDGKGRLSGLKPEMDALAAALGEENK